MQNKVAIEEHFALPEARGDSARYDTPYWSNLFVSLQEADDVRLAKMDAAGIEIAVLSLNGPGPQGIADVAQAIEFARRANDTLARRIVNRPDRFAGFAALPLQDPEAAAKELARCINDLGFKGALANGYSSDESSRAIYYDLPRYLPFWAEVEQIGVPFYLHARDSLPGTIPGLEGHNWLKGSPWGFAQETALHALRLMASGLFDRHPKLRIILGHLGEGIVDGLWRLDHRLKLVPNVPAKQQFGKYFRENFYITTSGNFSTQSLLNAIAVVGVDRILFAADYPFESYEEAAGWFDSASLSQAQRDAIGVQNARALLGLRTQDAVKRPKVAGATT